MLDVCIATSMAARRAHRAEQRDGYHPQVRREVGVVVALADEQGQLQVAGHVDALVLDQARDVAHAVVRVPPVQAHQEALQLPGDVTRGLQIPTLIVGPTRQSQLCHSVGLEAVVYVTLPSLCYLTRGIKSDPTDELTM